MVLSSNKIQHEYYYKRKPMTSSVTILQQKISKIFDYVRIIKDPAESRQQSVC